MQAESRKSTTLVAYVILGAVILAGLALRTWNVRFDGGLNSHPDERSTTCFYAPTIGWPSSVDEFLDPRRSPLNPLWDRQNDRRRSFTYGHFPLYLGILTGEVLSDLAKPAGLLPLPARSIEMMERANTACEGLAVAGRLMMALLDTLTVFLLFLLGRRLYGSYGGILAATLYAFTAQAVQLSHFFAMDPASTTFVVLAVYGGVLMVQERSWRGALLAGIGAGLAVSSKFSALPVLAVPLTASFIAGWRGKSQSKAVGERRGTGSAFYSFLVAMLAAAIVFFITSPYAVLDWLSFIQATLVEQGRMVRGVADLPFTRQYRNTIPYLYFIEQQVIWGMGLPLGLAALAGSAWALGKAVLFRAKGGELVVWAWLVPYFGITGAFMAKFNRYMSPVLPFVLLFTAGLIVWLLQVRVSPRYRLAARLPAVLLALIATGGGLFWTLAFTNGVYASEHTWVSASRWVYANAPAGSVILWEAWDDPLPKRLPGEPGMDMGSHGLRHIDWSPYEEDTEEKYEILREKLQEADYIIYSSKRIYDSVDELPARYPMTIRYYDLMFSEQLGFFHAANFETPPSLLGLTFRDHSADESWSLYDHPRVSIFAKERSLSGAEIDGLLKGSWEGAVHWDRGRDPPLSSILNAIGLGSTPESQDRGLINIALVLVQGQGIPEGGGQEPVDSAERSRPSLLLESPLRELPLVDDYRWNTVASNAHWLAVGWWWLVVSTLGWIAWPLAFVLFRGLRDRGFLLAKTLGWLVSGWLLWVFASSGLAQNTVRNAWLVAAMFALVSAGILFFTRRDLLSFVRRMWGILLIGEVLFAASFLFFVLIRRANPDIWQPWFGGEKFMEFAFLNGILRSPYFPPVDPHFAGGYINYYYYGIYLVGYLIKLTGIYAEVAFNLAIPTLFALTVVNAFAVVYSAGIMQPRRSRTGRQSGAQSHGRPYVQERPWHEGIGGALLAPLFVAIFGNLAGFGQLVLALRNVSQSTFATSVPGLETAVHAVSGLWRVIVFGAALPGFDFWSPSRVIPHTINEFPYWSFTYADLHPHMIGIPFSLFFVALVLTVLHSYNITWRQNWRYGALLAGGLAFTLGVLAAVNLWDLPTYLGLGVLTLAVALYRRRGRLHVVLVVGLGLAVAGGAYLLFLPFFGSYTNVAASGIGLVRAPDELGKWAQIWGFFAFVIFTWLLVGQGELRRLRLLKVHRLLVHRPTVVYFTGVVLLPVLFLSSMLLLLLSNLTVLAICLPAVGLCVSHFWRRERTADTGTVCAALLAVTGLAILAGTQIVYLKDHLQGGDAYRMNTLFKFYNQVWVLWGVAAAIALPRIFSRFGSMVRYRTPDRGLLSVPEGSGGVQPFFSPVLRLIQGAWGLLFLLLLFASLVYPLLGTPARLAQRFPGWRPPIGTLNGMAFMEKGVYHWPDSGNAIELRYDWEAIQWLLENVRGNLVLAESAQLDYYRAGGTRVASLTGLSGLLGMHSGEQHYREDVGKRHGKLSEFWNTEDIERVEALIDELEIGLIYVGQLERHQHPDADSRLEQLEVSGLLKSVYRNPEVTIYAVPSHIQGQLEGQSGARGW
ncbi:MAG: DUF2298 domain-containing protein [Caldilineaceae bacterium]|nr:DUF2298 domain-containing protein [Caldilineaceae bacterium]